MKLPNGSKFGVVKTRGLKKGNYDLYDLRGLSLGKLGCIRNALYRHALEGSVLADEIREEMYRMTVDGEDVLLTQCKP